LIDYELYWESNIITYSSSKMPNNTNTFFYIPIGTKTAYTNKGYPTNKLIERGYQLTVTGDKSIIKSSETSTITAKLVNNEQPVSSESLSYIIKHDGTTIDSGTVTTGSDGEAEITYTGTGVGEVNITVEYGIFLQETFVVYDVLFKDIGTSNNYGTWTSTDFTGTKISRNSECTTLTPEDNYDAQSLSVTGTSLVFEMDINLTYSVSTSENAFLRFIASTNRTFYPTGLGLQSGNWHHLKFVVSNDTVTAFVDGVDKGSQSISNITTFRFVLNNNYVSNMKYKNFVIYPI